MKEITIMAYTPLAGELAYQLMLQLREAQYLAIAYLFEKYKIVGCQSFKDGKQLIKESFEQKKPILFIGAVGIAVRLIAPFIQDKRWDAPVIVMDEKGMYAIPILSGHLGGANDYAILFARLTKGIPVITTATDIHHQFAIDVFAKKNQLYITDMEKAKLISAYVLQGQDYQNQYVISPYLKKESDERLLLVPKQLCVGIGCKRNTSVQQIEEAIEEIFKINQLHPKAIAKICSIDLKKEEQGILDFCKKYKIPYQTFSRQELLKIVGTFTPSSFVKEITGVDNVCERSALAGSRGEGEMIVPKQIRQGVTIAVVKMPLQTLIYD